MTPWESPEPRSWAWGRVSIWVTVPSPADEVRACGREPGQTRAATGAGGGMSHTSLVHKTDVPGVHSEPLTQSGAREAMYSRWARRALPGAGPPSLTGRAGGPHQRPRWTRPASQAPDRHERRWAHSPVPSQGPAGAHVWLAPQLVQVLWPREAEIPPEASTHRDVTLALGADSSGDTETKGPDAGGPSSLPHAGR